MKLERTFSGLEARLKSRGRGRFFSAGFLAFWLVGWVIGEAIALWSLGVGAWSLITGRPPEAGRNPLEVAPALAMGLFLLVWLSLWTFGGIAAIYELMRVLWSRDRLVVNPSGFEITRRTGFLLHTRWLARDELRSLYRLDAGSVVMAETESGVVELTRLGTVLEQEELVQAFTAELALPGRAARPVKLPEEWREIPSPEGGTLLLKDPATRRKQAVVAWVVTILVCAVAAVVIRPAFDRGTLVPLAVIPGAVGLAAVWGSLRLSRTRMETRTGPVDAAAAHRCAGPRVVRGDGGRVAQHAGQ